MTSSLAPGRLRGEADARGPAGAPGEGHALSWLICVVLDSGTDDDLALCIEQVQTGGGDVELVVATLRTVHWLEVPDVRIFRSTDAHALQLLVERECERARNVLVLDSTTSLGPAWQQAVHDQVAGVTGLVSGVPGTGPGALLFPSSVDSAGAGRTIWRPGPAIRVRGSAAPGSSVTTSAVVVSDGPGGLEATLASLASAVDETVVVPVAHRSEVAAVAARHCAIVLDLDLDLDLTASQHLGAALDLAASAATGDWVLHVEQGEVVEGSSAVLGRALAAVEDTWSSVRAVAPGAPRHAGAPAVREVRLARRGTATFDGAHKPQWGGAPARSDRTVAAPLTIIRSQDRGGAATHRDLAAAERELADAGPGHHRRADLVANLGEVLWRAGRPEQALRVLEELKVAAPGPAALVTAGRTAVGILDAEWRYEESAEWLELLLRWGEAPGNVALVRGRELLAMPQAGAAWECITPFLQGRSPGVDPWGRPCDPGEVEALAVEVLLQQGDGVAALERLRGMAAETPWAVQLAWVVDAHRLVGSPTAQFLTDAPAGFLAHSLEVLPRTHWRTALRWCEAFTLARPRDHRPIAAGTAIAARHGWRHALSWSCRARAAGATGVCALGLLVDDAGAAPVDRVVAALLRQLLFGVDAPAPVLDGVAARLTEAESNHVVDVVEAFTASPPDLPHRAPEGSDPS